MWRIVLPPTEASRFSIVSMALITPLLMMTTLSQTSLTSLRICELKMTEWPFLRLLMMFLTSIT